MTLMDRILGRDPEKPLKPSPALVPDEEFEPDEYDQPDQGDYLGSEP